MWPRCPQSTPPALIRALADHRGLAGHRARGCETALSVSLSAYRVRACRVLGLQVPKASKLWKWGRKSQVCPRGAVGGGRSTQLHNPDLTSYPVPVVTEVSMRLVSLQCAFQAFAQSSTITGSLGPPGTQQGEIGVSVRGGSTLPQRLSGQWGKH